MELSAEKEQELGVWINPPDWPQNFVLTSLLLIAQIIWLNMRH
jgi:hypothetical protein